MVESEEVHDQLIDCEKKCLDICERTTYFASRNSDTRFFPSLQDEIYKQANYSVIQLMIGSFDYPIFEETLKWTFPAFFGTIGGALGLWLGINILDTIINTMIGVRFLIRASKRKKVEKTTTRSVLIFVIKDDTRNSNC